jgi:hypothetical protein
MLSAAAAQLLSGAVTPTNSTASSASLCPGNQTLPASEGNNVPCEQPVPAALICAACKLLQLTTPGQDRLARHIAIV